MVPWDANAPHQRREQPAKNAFQGEGLCIHLGQQGQQLVSQIDQGKHDDDDGDDGQHQLDALHRAFDDRVHAAFIFQVSVGILCAHAAVARDHQARDEHSGG